MVFMESAIQETDLYFLMWERTRSVSYHWIWQQLHMDWILELQKISPMLEDVRKTPKGIKRGDDSSENHQSLEDEMMA